MGLYSPATRPLQHALSATSYKNWQSLTIGLNRVLSPVRLPVSPPGQIAVIPRLYTTYCTTAATGLDASEALVAVVVALASHNFSSAAARCCGLRWA